MKNFMCNIYSIYGFAFLCMLEIVVAGDRSGVAIIFMLVLGLTAWSAYTYEEKENG